MRKAILLITALAVLLTCPVLQAVAADTPEAAAMAYMTALKQNKIDEFVAMMHPDALAQFKKMMMPVVILAAEKGKEKPIMQLFKGVPDAKALAALSPAKVFKAFYEGLLVMVPNLRQILAGSKMQALGHVNEGSDIAHVVYRATGKGRPDGREKDRGYEPQKTRRQMDAPARRQPGRPRRPDSPPNDPVAAKVV